VIESSREVFPGCTLIVRASEGGCDEFGWNPEQKTPVRDIADFCYNRQPRRRPRLRLSSHVLASWHWPAADSPALLGIQELLKDYLAAQREESEASAGIAAILAALKPLTPPDSDLSAAVRALLAAPENADIDFYPDFSGLVVTAKTSEDPRDDTDESLFFRAVTLASHTTHVRRVTAEFVSHLGLAAFGHDLDVAAEAHDLGKSDGRFQAMLYGGRERLPHESLLAKSDSRSAGARRWAALLAGWPAGERHEFVSAALLAGSERARADSADWELVIHLVGAHHGFGRPFPPLVRDGSAVLVKAAFRGEPLACLSDHRLYSLGSGWVDRFWLLVARYGYWGLAFLESILRRGDCVASRMEEKGLFHD
jgi:CRISPR-associated endonuclease/helicase Cas3